MNINIKHFLVSFSALCAAAGFGSAYGADAAGATAAGVPVVTASSAAAEAEAIEAESQAAYVGWFLGLGLGYQYTKGEALLSDNLSANKGGTYATDLHGHSLLKSNVGKIGGSIIGGYGDFIGGNCYLGGEIGVDITDDKTKDSEEYVRSFLDATLIARNVSYGKTKIRTRGIVPTVAARIGWYAKAINSLIYARVGLTMLNNKFENTANGSFESQKISPIIGVGLETTCLGKYGVRLEGDYRFGADKTKAVSNSGMTPTAICEAYVGYVKNKVRGYAVRLIFVRHF